MTTALDTNILLDILWRNEGFWNSSLQAVELATQAGSVVICDVVYAELSGHFDKQDPCDRFLEQNQIRVESLTREARFLAGRVWRTYRRQGGKRERILPDFLIGAHAQSQASRLLSRDRGFYRRLFPDLVLVDPAR
jgi:predicted nucleic acid-binding protein